MEKPCRCFPSATPSPCDIGALDTLRTRAQSRICRGCKIRLIADKDFLIGLRIMAKIFVYTVRRQRAVVTSCEAKAPIVAKDEKGVWS